MYLNQTPYKKIAVFHPYGPIHSLFKDVFTDDNYSTVVEIPFTSLRRENISMKTNVEKFLIQEKPHVAIVGIEPENKERLAFLKELQNKDEIETKFVATTTLPQKLTNNEKTDTIIPIYQEPLNLNELYEQVELLTETTRQDHPIKKEQEF